MNKFKLAVAQVSSIRGDVDSNIATHLKAIMMAGKLDVNYLVFPELSITGYEPELAEALAFSENDKRLKPLINAAIENCLYIAIGAPIASNSLPKIGLIIISPSGVVDIYQKMNLHAGEERYFSKGNQYHHVDIDGIKVLNAICADTNNADHAKYCIEISASVYVAGVLIGEPGYHTDTLALQNYAKKYNLLVAIANYNRPTGAWSPVGKSAIWSSSGLLAQANEIQDALVVAEKKENSWSAQVLEI